jgi:hypothetical protein
MITDSNHACSAKMATCGFQEGVFTKKEFQASLTIESKGGVSIY